MGEHKFDDEICVIQWSKKAPIGLSVRTKNKIDLYVTIYYHKYMLKVSIYHKALMMNVFLYLSHRDHEWRCVPV